MHPQFATLRNALLAVSFLTAVPQGLSQQEAETNRVREQVRRHLDRHGIVRMQSARGEVVRVGEDVVVKEGEKVGDTVVVMGDAQIDGEVGDLVVILGTATLGPTALVKRDLVVIGGNLRADAKSQAEREVFVFGGKIQAPDDALIHQRARVFKGLDLSDIKWSDDWQQDFPRLKMGVDWVTHGLLLGRPLPPSLGWVWWIVAVIVLSHLVLAVLFPKPLQSCVDALDRRPIGSFFAGLLALVLFGPVLVLLAFTGVGLIVVPFVVCALMLAMLFGKVAVYRYAGQQFGRQLGLDFLQTPLVALLAGTALLYLLYMIPVVGFLAWGVLSVLGVGNATVAGFSGLRRERAATHPGELPEIATPGAAPPLIQQANAWPRVGFWRRLLAMAMDAMLVLVVVLVLAAVTRMRNPAPLLFLAWTVYHLALWSTIGTTVGGMAMRLKIVREDGRAAGFSVALVRALASVFSAMVFFLGFFWAGWSRQKRSWHDFIAGTIVVRVPRGVTVA